MFTNAPTYFGLPENPSSGSLVQCLAKITRMVLSCPLTWTVVGAMAAYAAIAPSTEHFIILIMSANYVFVHKLYNKVFICH